jgi:hypothetical protein
MATLHHAGQQRRQQRRGRGHVQVHHGLRLGRALARERPLRQHAGVVDQPVDATPPAPERGHQLGHAAGCGQVGRPGLGAGAVLLLQLRGQGLQLVGTARHQQHAVAVTRQAMRQRLADARRGAGDQGGAGGRRCLGHW